MPYTFLRNIREVLHLAKLMIFDMDGVLCDSEPCHDQAREFLLKKFGITDVISDATGRSHVEIWEPLIEKYHLTMTQPEIERMQHELVLDMIKRDRLPLNEGVLAALEELERRGIPAAVASSSSRWLVEHILEHYGILSSFCAVLTGNDITKRKPSPEIYLKTLQQCQTRAEDALALEDSVSGLRSAQAAGIRCLRYQPAPDTVSFETLRPYETIRRIDDLLSYI